MICPHRRGRAVRESGRSKGDFILQYKSDPNAEGVKKSKKFVDIISVSSLREGGRRSKKGEEEAKLDSSWCQVIRKSSALGGLRLSKDLVPGGK